MFDIPGQIRKAITEFIADAATKAVNPVLEAFALSWLSTPDLTGNDKVRAMWQTSLITVNAVFVLFVVVAGFIVASHQTLQTSHGLKQLLPRLVVGAVAANTSLIVCGKAIEFTNALTVSITGQGVDAKTTTEAFRQIITNVLQGTNVLMSLLVIAVIVMILLVVLTFVLRVAMLVLLLGIAPLALACHATPYTEGIAFAWWRAFGVCLGLQIGQAVIVLGTVKIFLTPAGPTALGIPASGSGLIGILVCLTMLWALVKMPGWSKQFILGPLGGGRGLISQLVQAYVMVKTLGAAAGALGGGSRAATTANAARQDTRSAATGRTARAVPGPRGGRGTPRPAPSRPSPAGPVAFSNAPTPQTPLSAPAGTAGTPTFSHPPQPGTPTPTPTGPAPAASFSQPNAPQPATPRRGGRPAPAAFSGTAPSPASPTPAGPAPATTFSNPPARQSALRRPPAPVTPVFSSAPKGTSAGRPTAARRPTAATRPTAPGRSNGGGRPPATTTPAPPPTARPSPRQAPAASPSPAARPAPAAQPPPSPPRPAGSAAPVFRPAPSPPPSPPSPPPQRPSPPPARRRPPKGR
ncbi:conjugal transfer protein TrbL family protein [Salinispora arenicola]|nr:conjugal transfer protein TrbL family protein [Salinispora arenicola]